MQPTVRYKAEDFRGTDAPKTYPTVETSEGPRTSAFGRLWPEQNDISLHLTAWRIGLTKADGGLGPLRHLIEAHNLIWPARISSNNEWLFRRFRAFCQPEKYRIVTLAGGSGTAKSTDLAAFILLWWWANPAERAVLLGSTTLGSLKKRIWSYVVALHAKARGDMPGIVTGGPPPQIMFRKGDPKHGIHGTPLKPGTSERALADLIGIHPDEALLVGIDEASDVTPAVNDAMINWDDANGKLHQVIMMANSKSRLDPHGKASEPRKGWSSINPDVDEEWETKVGGICLFFDCYKSPAIHAPNKENLQFLIGEKKIKKEEVAYGKNDPRFWRFVRGFWPPDDLGRTVLTLGLVEQKGARRKLHWSGEFPLVRLGACDPAFTSEGDECILRFAVMGMMTNGRWGIEFDEMFSLNFDTRPGARAISYQIVEQCKKECIVRGVEPQHFAIDTWGFGTGAGDIIQEEWSPDVIRIISIGSPSNRWVDSDMANKALDVYDRRVTELWFAMKMFVDSEQIGGLDDVTIEQFCSRSYDWLGKKMRLEGKRDYKKRMGREDGPTGSPDQADAAAFIIEAAQQNGMPIAARTETDNERRDWQEKWEEARGYSVRGEKAEDREATWNADAILDSESFESSEWD